MATCVPYKVGSIGTKYSNKLHKTDNALDSVSTAPRFASWREGYEVLDGDGDEGQVEGCDARPHVRGRVAGVGVVAEHQVTEAADGLLAHHRLPEYTHGMYNTIQYDTMRCDTIRYDTIRYDTIQYNTIQYNTTLLRSVGTIWDMV